MTSLQKITLFALCMGVLGACGSTPVELPEGRCYEQATVTCVIELATVSAAVISDPADQSTAALEIATAQFAAGEALQSAASIRSALSFADDVADASQQSKAKVAVQATSSRLACTAIDFYDDARRAVKTLTDPDESADQLGKLTVALALCRDLDRATQHALAMPQHTDMLASYKARTLHELAPIVAEKQSLAAAESLLTEMDMGLPYYRAVGANEVARVAIADQQTDRALPLLAITEALADAEENGYFKAGMYREAAATYVSLGDAQTANALFKQAIAATELAPSDQHKARSLSRAATVLADVQYFDLARSVFPASVRTATDIESPQLRSWAFYEIAGGAAFSGDFATASAALAEIPDTLEFSGSRLLSAAQRDVAWGYAKHGAVRDALMLAASIETPRERVQALSRIARLLADPDMHALPRYL